MWQQASDPQQPEKALGAIDHRIGDLNERLMKDLIFLREAIDRVSGAAPPSGTGQITSGPAPVPNGALETINMRLNETAGLLDSLSELVGRANILA